MDKIYELVEDRNLECLSTSELIEDVEKLLDCNRKLDFIESLNRFNISIEETIIYLCACKECLSGNEYTYLNQLCNMIWTDTGIKFKMKMMITKGLSKLMTNELIKLEEGYFRRDETIMLTEKSINLLLKDDADILLESIKPPKGLINCDEIKSKELFYNSESGRQLAELTSLLKDRNFRQVQKRLKDSNMPTGVAVLFHGSPGTGKTASIYKIATETKRDILLVDISDTKSMWFGESEKKIKAIFTNYKELLKQDKPVPILLFNEADAIFGKRRDLNGAAVRQTENAIQNIILQEMEDFEGILIATTNMTNNFDKAFERRFLYKIEFTTPIDETKAKIWKSKIPKLTNKQSTILAKQFNLSGGNIENIARKMMMKSILKGDSFSFISIIELCRSENFNLENKRNIGY